MQSLVFITYFFQMLWKKNFWGSAGPLGTGRVKTLEELMLEKSYHSVIVFLRDYKNLMLYVLILDLIENAL